MVASCVTGGVLVADSAVSGRTVGKMDNQEVFSFENQQLSNAMPTFTAPIGETTQIITATTENLTEAVPAVNQEYIAETTTQEITATYSESYVTEAVQTEKAVTTTVTDSAEEIFTEVVTTAITTAVTTTTTTTTVSSSEEATTTTTTTTTTSVPETTSTTTTEVFTEPIEWFYMETQPIQIMDSEPVCTEPVSTEPVCTEPVFTEPVYTEPVCTEPVYTEPVYTEPEAEYYSTPVYISDSDFILLCNAVAHEAGSDWIDVYSKANVVEVIMNRVNSPLFPDSVYDVLSQPYQFEGSETYTYLSCYSYEVTDSVIEAVNLYFSDPYSFSHGYMYFYGDGYQNHFSVSQ